MIWNSVPLANSTVFENHIIFNAKLLVDNSHEEQKNNGYHSLTIVWHFNNCVNYSQNKPRINFILTMVIVHCPCCCRSVCISSIHCQAITLRSVVLWIIMKLLMEFLFSLIHGLTGASVISDNRSREFSTSSGNKMSYMLNTIQFVC